MGIGTVDGFQNGRERTAAAAYKHRVRGGEAAQGLRGRALYQAQGPGAKPLPVGAHQRQGLRFPLYGPDLLGLKSQLHADAAGARSNVPAYVLRSHRQISKGGGADLPLGHGNAAPEKFSVRNSRRTPGKDGSGLSQE